MKKTLVSKIILSRILRLPLSKFLKLIEQVTGNHPSFNLDSGTDFMRNVYARIIIEEGRPSLRVSDERLLKTYVIPQFSNLKQRCSLNWINTRNRFCQHILRNLLHHQRDYWLSGRDADLRPLSFREFLVFYPLESMDSSRLSRLIANLRVVIPSQEVVFFRGLFPSPKRVAAYRIKELLDVSPAFLTDREIQHLLSEQGFHLSLRTICNCRKLLYIPNHRHRRNGYYGTVPSFGELQRLADKKFGRIPSDPGVYELVLSEKLVYPKGQSEVVYIGCTRDLRRRIASYSGNGVKNRVLDQLLRSEHVLVRFCRVECYRTLEKELLSRFRTHYGALPKANIIGAI